MAYRIDHPTLLVGETVIDWIGALWKRTNVRNSESNCDDNYYYLPLECYCDVEVGGGYTYSDEHGGCDHCEGLIRQIFGHNTAISVNFDGKDLFEPEKKGD